MFVIHAFTRYFVRGLLVVAPAAVTIYVLYTALMWVDGLLALDRRLGVALPGVGALIIVAGVLWNLRAEATKIHQNA